MKKVLLGILGVILLVCFVGCSSANSKKSTTTKVVSNLSTTHFDFNKSNLKTNDQAMLKQYAAQYLKNKQAKSIVVSGYADSVGTEKYNVGLSNRRAAAVASYLVSCGIAKTKIVVKGYGEANPVASNTTEQGRIQNRRAVVVLG